MVIIQLPLAYKEKVIGRGHIPSPHMLPQRKYMADSCGQRVSFINPQVKTRYQIF
jgi:hypothetical protein